MLKIKNKIPSALTIGGKIVERIKMRNEVVWEKVVEPVDADYFYVENTYAGKNTISVKQTITGEPDSSLYTKTLQYSKDKTNWTTITLSSTPYTIDLNQGEKVYIRGNEGVFNYYSSSNSIQVCTNITGNQSHNIGGNINTLINYYTPNNLTLPQGVFFNVFRGSVNLVSAENLTLQPSKDGSVSNSAYLFMFRDCSSLITPPQSIPATNMGPSSCNGMFQNCTSLLQAPQLPATTLANYCYKNIFYKCSSLVQAPELPATTLALYCYESAFQGCTSLIIPPELPAKTLTTNCYQRLFYGCSKLNNITVYAKDISATNCTTDWLSGVSSTGTFNNYGGVIYTVDSPSGIPTGWTQNRDSTNYFYIQNKTSNSTNYQIVTSSYNPTSDNYAKSLQCSTDKKTWTTITLDNNSNYAILLYPGEKVYFRNDSGYFNWYEYEGLGYIYTYFECFENYAVGGNVMSLIDYNNMDTAQLSDGCFFNLFMESYHLTDASKLILPNKTAPNCFRKMFYNCPELTKAPVLSATELSDGCYQQLFYGCSKLNSLTVYVNDVSANNCTTDWLSGVSSTGTFYNYGSATYELDSVSGIPEGWIEVKE